MSTGSFASKKREELRRLLVDRACQFGAPDQFLLASGKRSDTYVDGKLVTLTGEGLSLIAELLWERMVPLKPDAVGGFVIGADPIVGAVLGHAHMHGSPITGFLVRKEPKKHGTSKLIEGPRPTPKHPKLVFVDDVVTTGDSVLKAIKQAQEEWNADVAGVFALVDREEGAVERFKNSGIHYEALYTLSQLRPAATPPRVGVRSPARAK